MGTYIDGSQRLAHALVRAGVIAAGEVSSIHELTIKAVAGQPLSLHIKRFGDLPRIEAALAELDPADVDVQEGVGDDTNS